MEKEATGESAAEALQYTSCSEMEIPLHINEEDYIALTKRAEVKILF